MSSGVSSISKTVFDKHALILEASHIANKYQIKIFDYYVASEKSSGAQVLLIICSGYDPTDPNQPLIVWKHKKTFYLEEERKAWSELIVMNPEISEKLFNLFFDPLCTSMLVNHTNIVGIFPSAIYKNGTPHGIIHVIVQAKGYTPLHETEIETHISTSEFTAETFISEGFFSPMTTKRGDSIGCHHSYGGYGTIGCIVESKSKKEDDKQKYVVTCKHVVERSRSLVIGDDKIFCSPSPGYMKYKLLRQMKERIFDPDGGFIYPLDSQFYYKLTQYDADTVRREMKNIFESTKRKSWPFHNMGVDLTVKETIIYCNNENTIIGKEAIFLDPMEFTWNCTWAKMSFDVALVLIPINDDCTIENRQYQPGMTLHELKNAFVSNGPVLVNKISASTEANSAWLFNFIHVNDIEHQSSDILWTFTRQTRQWYSQIMLYGHGFGMAGDSGGLVVADETQKAVGIFTGSLGGNVYTCSSSECLTKEFHILQDFSRC